MSNGERVRRDRPREPAELDRRQFLTAAALGALALDSALAAGCSRRDSRPEVPPSWPTHPADMPKRSVDSICFFALGDTGWQTPEKRAVADAMTRTAPECSPDFVLMLGDNFYRAGVSSIDDPQWKSHFEEAYGREELNVDFYAALGNHDHNGSVEAQIDYTRTNSRWKMPGRCYRVGKSLGDKELFDLFVIDTTPIYTGDDDGDAQVAWLEHALEGSRARWKIVAGHHPVRSNGAHGAIAEVADALEPLFRSHGVSAYLAGHDHDLQVLRTDEGWLQVVSGGGSSVRPVVSRSDTLFCESAPGFVRAQIEPDAMWLQVVTASEGARFTHRSPRA